MTREEAINNLESLYNEVYNEDSDGHIYAEAIDMAIEALQFAKHFDLLKEYQSLQEVVRCKDCRYKVHCHETVAHTRIHDDFKEHWSEPIEFCSKGERREE